MHDYDCDPRHLRARYGPEVKPQEVVDRRWTGGRILTLDGYPHRGQPICLSEFGGIAYKDPERYAGSEWGYQSAKDKDDFARMVTSLLEVAGTTALFSGFCYTQFADTFQEANGLLYEDRTPKIPLERIAAAVRDRPLVRRKHSLDVCADEERCARVVHWIQRPLTGCLSTYTLETSDG